MSAAAEAPWEGDEEFGVEDESVASETGLAAVPNRLQGDEDDDILDIPLGKPVNPADGDTSFEGRQVERSEVKIQGVTSLESLDDWRLSVDDRVRIVVETKVTGVSHHVDKDGNLVRQHVLKQIRTDVTPWDPSNPDDRGVLRG